MKFYIHIYIFVGFVALLFSDANAKPSNSPCQKLLNLFKQSNTQFLDCSLENSVPVNFCLNCYESYTSMEQAYSNLYNGQKTIELSCKEIYFDLDALNLIQKIYQSSAAVWNAATCSNCWTWSDNKANVSDSTIALLHKSSELNICIDSGEKDNNITALCESCKQSYLDLNNFYDKIKTSTCFDIKDLMNRTRLNWSSNLKCCKDKENTSKTLLIAVSSTLSSCVLVFYTGFYIYMRRRRQYEMIVSPANDAGNTIGQSDAIEQHSSSAAGSILPANEHRNYSSIEANPEDNFVKSKFIDKQKLLNDNDDDTTDDDEPILSKKQYENTKQKEKTIFSPNDENLISV